MSVDINLKYLEHPRYNSNEIEVSSEFEQILQQIELILFTQKGTVLGNEDFGASVEDYLFKLNVNPRSLERSITNELNKEIPDIDKYQLQVNAELFDRAADSVGVVTISLKDIKRNPEQITKLQAIFR